jgi:hypothetical protein
MRWSTADIADAVYCGLLAKREADNLEQVVYGFDANDELGLHPIIQQSLRDAGYAVFPEQRYPADWTRRRKSEGKRCDVVLSDNPNATGLSTPELMGTLFESSEAVDPAAAYWLEIKTVAQFETGGPFARYASELLQPVTQDVKKIWTDSGIYYGGLLIVLFTQNQATAEHDLGIWHNRAIERGYPVMPPALRGLPIVDRIGNAWCGIGMFGVRGA